MTTLCLGVMLSGLDGAIVNTALPTMSRELQASPSASVWIATAYQLAVMISLLPWAALGEARGYRKVYLGGMGVFVAASLACGFSPNLAVLVGARVLQGLAGGAMIGVSMALVRFIYPKRLLGAGLSLYGMMAAVSMTLGPSLASAILSVGPWPWLFLINLPIGIAAIVIGGRLLPANAGQARPFDWTGAALSALMFAALIGGLGGLGDRGQPLKGLALLLAGAALAAMLIPHQLRRPAPLLPIDLLRAPLFSLSAATSVCTYAAQSAAFVGLPFLFQHGLGRSAVEIGLLMTPWPLMIALAAPVSGRLADRAPPGTVTAIGLAMLAGSLLSLALIRSGAGDAEIVVRMAICGAGVGLFQAPNNRAMMTSAPAQRSGAASGFVAICRNLGMAAGSAAASMALGLFLGQGAATAALIGVALAAIGCVLSLARAFNRPVVAAEA